MSEAEVKLEQIQLHQESPEEIREENVVIGEEQRLCQEEEQVQEQEEEEIASQEVGSGGADLLLSTGLVAELGAALQDLISLLLLTLLSIGHDITPGLVPLLPICLLGVAAGSLCPLARVVCLLPEFVVL